MALVVKNKNTLLLPCALSLLVFHGTWQR